MRVVDKASSAAAMGNNRQSLQEQLRERMLSGEPFTALELSSQHRRQDPHLYDRLDGDRMIGQLIQVLRRAGRITHQKDGHKIIWRAHPSADKT